MGTLSYQRWSWAAAGLLVGACAVLFSGTTGLRLITLLVIPPLVAGLTTTPRRTAIVAAVAVGAAIAAGTVEGSVFLSTTHLLRVLVVSAASALAVQTSILRERDLRTRRRLNLINAARNQLDAAAGIEDDLTSFCRAAIAANFAEWAILDIRLPDGTTVRVVEQSDFASKAPAQVRNTPTAATTAYEQEVQREGGLLLRPAPTDLLLGLFEGDLKKLKTPNVMVKPISVGDLKAVYFFVCPRPHPPWGEAELTQVGSLTRTAAQKARSDQLIDRLTHAQQSLRESRDEIEAIVGNIANGVTAQTPDGKIVYANDTAARMLGFRDADDLIGRHFSEGPAQMVLRDEEGQPFDQNELPSRRALRGEVNPTASLRWVLNSTGEEIWAFVRSRAVLDADGVPTLAITVLENQTDRRREELAQGFLSDASKQLGESLDFNSALRTVARAAVPAMADWCTIELVSPSGSLETVAVAHAEPRMEEDLWEFREKFPPRDPDHGPARVLKTGDSELFGEFEPDAIKDYYGDSEMSRALERLAPRSTMITPIVSRGRTIGTISMSLTRAGTQFTDFDVETAEELGRRAGIALDNARLHTERMRMLESLQKSLIPARLPELPGLDLSAQFRPAEVEAEVGGDFYDAFELPDGSAALVMGDVCGKGPEAAALTALARYTIRATAMDQSDPQAILAHLNAALIEQVTDGRFCTLAFVKIADAPDGQVAEVVSAGHPLPIMLAPDGPRAIGEPGTLLGVVPDPDLPVARVPLAAGSSLVLYTDGLSAGQTTDDTAYALELIAGLSINGNRDIAGLIDRQALRLQSAPNRDDTAILAAKVLGTG